MDAMGGAFGPELINAVARGINVKVVAGLNSYIPGWDAGFLTVRKELIDSGKVREMKDLKGLKVASYYGCLLVRPQEITHFDDPENPQMMDKLMTTLGAQPLQERRPRPSLGVQRLRAQGIDDQQDNVHRRVLRRGAPPRPRRDPTGRRPPPAAGAREVSRRVRG